VKDRPSSPREEKVTERDPDAEPFDFTYGGDLEQRMHDFFRLRKVDDGSLIMSREEHVEWQRLLEAGYYELWQRWRRLQAEYQELPSDSERLRWLRS
jgi:hypothetical protein